MLESQAKLNSYLERIDILEKEFLSSAQRIMKAGKSDIHKLDYFALSIISRAISLNKGFKTLLEKENTLSAVSLLRLQLDNLIRYNAILESEEPLKFMEHILDNKSITQYKENNERFTDNLLAKKLDKRFPNSFNLYKYLCSYVHFGYTHVDYIFREKEIPTEKSSSRVVVGDNDNFSLKAKIDYTENLIVISYNLITLMNQWATIKDSQS